MSLLDPDARTVYLSALRPPMGYTLDRAIGTTYSLDLMTLLAVPLAFALFDRAEAKDDLLKDPVLLLEALRRYAGRTTVFCNVGQIGTPSGQHPLFIALEPMVTEVRAPKKGGVFHPKVWVLRFVAPGVPVKYRVLVLSRNLTPDRSWDTVLTLEGDLTDRERAFSRNHPLADFVAALPQLAVGGMESSAVDAIKQLADELRVVDFEVPDRFESFEFWPMGIEGYSKTPFDSREHKRALVVSPFVRAEVLAAIGGSDEDILIARPEELDAIGAAGLASFPRIYTVCDAVESDSEAPPPASTGPSPAGLHAKVFVLDHGWDSHVITGSANATVAAMRRNVEFCVELVGKKSRVGIDEVLDSGLSGLLQPYKPSTEPVTASAEQLAAERRLEELREVVIGADIVAHASAAEIPGTFDVELRARHAPLVLPEGVSAHARPVTLQAPAARPITELVQAGCLVFPGVSLLGITAFYAFTAEATVGDETCGLEFVLRVPLENCPAGREQAVLHSVIGNRSNLMRYLMLLLADEVDGIGGSTEVILRGAHGSQPGSPAAGPSIPVLEQLLRVYARSPAKLDAIDRLVTDLERDPQGAQLLPEGFEPVWKAIWAARQRSRGAS